MRLKNVRGSRERIAANEYALKNVEENKGHWKDYFGDNLPIHIEIGMGKGQFLMEMARTHPGIHYIGIEMFSSVLVRAVQKIEEDPLPNIHFIRMDATFINQVFAPGEVERIYLNFSDPWPKERHAKRRLTSHQFLARYRDILTKDGIIEFKTDNRSLFDFSVEEVKNAGWVTDLVTYDLHHSPYLEGNVMTEYEERFVAKGNPICKMIFHQHF